MSLWVMKNKSEKSDAIENLNNLERKKQKMNDQQIIFRLSCFVKVKPKSLRTINRNRNNSEVRFMNFQVIYTLFIIFYAAALFFLMKSRKKHIVRNLASIFLAGAVFFTIVCRMSGKYPWTRYYLSVFSLLIIPCVLSLLALVIPRKYSKKRREQYEESNS